MSSDCWTDRYTGERIPDSRLILKAPLRHSWTYEPGQTGLGFVRAGYGLVFASVGGSVVALNPDSGKTVWRIARPASLITRWRSSLLVCGNGRVVRMKPKNAEIEWEQSLLIGLSDSFVIDDVIVGGLPRGFLVLELSSMRKLWEVPELHKTPLTYRSGVIIRHGNGVQCLDLRTGAMKWERSESDLGGEAFCTGCVWRDTFMCIVGLETIALEVASGKTVWAGGRASFNWLPYGDRAYNLTTTGKYFIQDLSNGKVVFEREIGPKVPAPVRMKKKGLMVGTKGKGWNSWRDPWLAVSETHTFAANASGQIVVLARDTGELEQVVEIPGMPRGEPIIYENHLLLTDFAAAVHCFKGAD